MFPRRAPKPSELTNAAMVRLGDLVVRGIAAERIGREAEAIAEELVAKGEDGQELIRQMLDLLAEGIAAAEEHAEDVLGAEPAAVTAARNAVAGLQAARRALKR